MIRPFQCIRQTSYKIEPEVRSHYLGMPLVAPCLQEETDIFAYYEHHQINSSWHHRPTSTGWWEGMANHSVLSVLPPTSLRFRDYPLDLVRVTDHGCEILTSGLGNNQVILDAT
jgi:hypothetical protein